MTPDEIREEQLRIDAAMREAVKPLEVIDEGVKFELPSPRSFDNPGNPKKATAKKRKR